MVKKRSKAKTPMADAQHRNAQIFRLRGFWANAKTLPFISSELNQVLSVVDNALKRHNATTQTEYERLAKLPK